VKTPRIPSRIRRSPSSAYTSIYEFCPNETRLYGTESLYGDWDGELLLLSKDFAPRWVVEKRVARGDLRPFRHEDVPGRMGFQTNRNLRLLADDIPCGKLYGSALAGLLRNDNKTSGALPDYPAIRPYMRDVLRWVIEQMPNLRAIACLGADAWRCATGALDVGQVDRASIRDPVRPLEADGLQVFALHHTSRWFGGKAAVCADWDALRVRLHPRQ